MICQEKNKTCGRCFSGWPEWHQQKQTQEPPFMVYFLIFGPPRSLPTQDLRKLKPIQEGEYLMYSCKSRLTFFKWNYFEKHSQMMEWWLLFCFVFVLFPQGSSRMSSLYRSLKLGDRINWASTGPCWGRQQCLEDHGLDTGRNGPVPSRKWWQRFAQCVSSELKNA